MRYLGSIARSETESTHAASWERTRLIRYLELQIFLVQSMDLFRRARPARTTIHAVGGEAALPSAFLWCRTRSWNSHSKDSLVTGWVVTDQLRSLTSHSVRTALRLWSALLMGYQALSSTAPSGTRTL